MKQLILAMSVLSVAVASASVATVSDVVLSQGDNKRVTVSYTLDAPAIVTVDFLTNGVSIGEQNFTDVFGDVNRLVSKVGETCTISWKPYRSWPNRTIGDSGFTAKVTAWTTNAPPDYLVVDLTMWTDNNQSGPACTRFYTSTNALPFGGLANDMYRTTKLVMRRIPAANVKWRMGSPSTETGRKANETTHYVTLSEDYYLGIYPVTVRQMYLITGWTDGDFRNRPDGAMHPYEKITYQGLRGDVGRANWLDGADPYAVEEWKGIWA